MTVTTVIAGQVKPVRTAVEQPYAVRVRTLPPSPPPMVVQAPPPLLGSPLRKCGPQHREPVLLTHAPESRQPNQKVPPTLCADRDQTTADGRMGGWADGRIACDRA